MNTDRVEFQELLSTAKTNELSFFRVQVGTISCHPGVNLLNAGEHFNVNSIGQSSLVKHVDLPIVSVVVNLRP